MERIVAREDGGIHRKPPLAPAAPVMTAERHRAGSIRASVRDVETTLLMSIGLVVLVVLLFLRRLRATLIPAVAIPLSLTGTFVVTYLHRLQHRQPVAHG
jgi:multidrug efflux pump